MPIGSRLREERERLGLSQPSFAAIAATTKQTVFSWESGKTAPDGFQLSALAGQGVDVLYVITGQRAQSSPIELDSDELVHLACLRKATPERRHDSLRALLSKDDGATKPVIKKERVVSTNGGVAAGRDVTFGNSEKSGGQSAKSRSNERSRSRA